MIDWLADHAWVTWVGIAVVLAVVELMSLDLVLLMFALGALGAAVVAGLGGPVWLALLVFAVVSTALLFLVRPPLVERLHAGPTLPDRAPEPRRPRRPRDRARRLALRPGQAGQ